MWVPLKVCGSAKKVAEAPLYERCSVVWVLRMVLFEMEGYSAEGGGTHIDFLLWSSHPSSAVYLSCAQ